MKILTYTTLYPNSVQKRHGIFIENRLRHLVKEKNVEATVIAPVPWFPFKNPRFGSYSEFASVPSYEKRFGIDVYHPRFPVIPKIGMNISPSLLFHFTKNFTKKIIEKVNGVDLIDAHYFYPDGVAAARIGQLLNLPVVISARGTDINVIPNYPVPRKQILEAAKAASGLIAVSKALKNKLIEIGVERDKIHTIRNGVNLNQFSIKSRDEIRKKYDLNSFTLLSVGNLVELKGQHLVISALKHLSDIRLIIVGQGEQEATLKEQVKMFDLKDRVLFFPNLSQDELALIYNAVDVTVLASSREGMPNVVLESLACGTPVIATNVGGVPEILDSEISGIILDSRSVDNLVEAIKKIKNISPQRLNVRAYAEQFDWSEVVERQFGLYKSVIGNA